MIDHATLNLVSRFASRTHLTADLSHTNQDAVNGRHDNVAVGNYHYDDGSCVSLGDEDNGRILEGAAGVSVDGGPAASQFRSGMNSYASGPSTMSLNRRIN